MYLRKYEFMYIYLVEKMVKTSKLLVNFTVYFVFIVLYQRTYVRT